MMMNVLVAFSLQGRAGGCGREGRRFVVLAEAVMMTSLVVGGNELVWRCREGEMMVLAALLMGVVVYEV